MLDGEDMLFYKENGQIVGGGYGVNNILMKQGLSPLITLNSSVGGSEKVSDLFGNLVIPNLFLSYDYKRGGGNIEGNIEDEDEDEDEDDNVIQEDLHQKLLNLVKKGGENTFKKTKKSKKSTSKKTKKLRT